MKRIFSAMIVVILLVGCSSQGSLSRDDLCIQRTNDKAKICYGMERAEAEKVAGKGHVDKQNSSRFSYENELEVTYRANKVVLINIRNDYFEHISGIGVGKLSNEMEKKYGTSIDGGYYFDEENNKMLSKDDLKKIPHPETIKALSTYVDENGYIFSLSVGDLKSFTAGF